ncbi:ganglioside GM2 activator-like [Porites lutea]|uniref:ganglioside GM2 activator-like n=1 Tax=Porites lutea TaxID=51062 RepID=UPI003CC55FF0
MVFTRAFLLVIVAFSVDALKWSNCDGSSPIQIKDISLSPHPVILRKGAKVTFSGKFKVESAVGINYKIDVTLKREGWWGIWIPIPCFGKCTHDIGCNQLISLLEGERCPLRSPKEYIVRKQEHVLPDVNIPSFLTSGTYKVQADLRDKASNKRISCVEAVVTITE